MPEIKPPKELISQYESQGMDSQQASLKVIGDLQKAKVLNEYSRNMDAVNNSLAKLNGKLDSKPGGFTTFVIGLASGCVIRKFMR